MRTFNLDSGYSAEELLHWVRHCSPGESFVLTSGGLAMATVVVLATEENTGKVPAGGIQRGLLSGRSVPEDFDSMAGDEIAALFSR